MDKNSFILYTDYFEQLEMLSMEQRGVLLTACMMFQLGRDLPPMDDFTKMAYLFISADMRRNNAKYEEIVEQRKIAGRKGGFQKQANLANLANATFAKQNLAKPSKASKTKQSLANLADNDNETDNEDVTDNDDVDETDKDNEVNSSAGQSGSHTKPSFKEVADEVAEKGYRISSIKFFKYYENNGWKTNEGEPIRDWKKMLAVWDMKERFGVSPESSGKSKPKKNAFNSFDQREYSNDDLEARYLSKG